VVEEVAVADVDAPGVDERGMGEVSTVEVTDAVVVPSLSGTTTLLVPPSTEAE